MSWARLLKRVFDIDIEHCPNCGGSLKIIAAIEASAGDCQNPQPSGLARPRPAALPGAAIRSIPNGLRAQTGCQRKPTAPLALSSSERPDGGQITRLRPLRRPSQPKQHRDFHQAERELTTPRPGDIAGARKKGGLNFLYIRVSTNGTNRNRNSLFPVLAAITTMRGLTIILWIV